MEAGGDVFTPEMSSNAQQFDYISALGVTVGAAAGMDGCAALTRHAMPGLADVRWQADQLVEQGATDDITPEEEVQMRRKKSDDRAPRPRIEEEPGMRIAGKRPPSRGERLRGAEA